MHEARERALALALWRREPLIEQANELSAAIARRSLAEQEVARGELGRRVTRLGGIGE